MRGIRGATTVDYNEAEHIWTRTRHLLEEMVEANNVCPEQVVHIWFTVTSDIDAAFPAKATRRLPGDWSHVPVMCATEIPVPNSLPRCIRVMVTANTEVSPRDIHHVFQEDAIKLRPDLTKQAGGDYAKKEKSRKEV
ncbi:chorismate mutase [Salicibibacter halophilus]|uniref:chorismate mutase n=1 Tax=Salicibibacter halophilus TaxID=2502791 RepID=A0A514LDM4_9BACI|nr:chorismate mutase [Salicibibacter halophilus]QDI89956.1 chorismate mutase [Salicibibacter halophilus]